MNEEFDPAVEYADDHRDQRGLPEVDVEEIKILVPMPADDEERRNSENIETEDRGTAERDAPELGA
jgi:hypothetical protein